MLALIQTIRQILESWWSKFTLQTRLMATVTLIVSLLMSGLTFWAVNTIQQEAQMNDNRFGRDLGLLIAANVSPLIAEGDMHQVARLTERFYRNTSSVRYIIYADEDGKIIYGIPYSEEEVKNSLSIERRINLPEDYAANEEQSMVRQHTTSNGEVTDVFVPIKQEKGNFGTLAIGINPNPTVVYSSNLTRDVTIAVFISIWAMVILGAVINALTITKPIKELLKGVKSIAAGNFKQRIILPLGGELSELINSFNEMAERLERYEEQNIEELTAEKAKLETLVATIADGALLINTDLQLILANFTARRMFGWDEKEIIGNNVLHHLPSEITSQLTKPLYRIAAGEEINNEEESEDLSSEKAEFRITLNQPHQRIVRVLLTQVFDRSEENVRGIVMTVQDITREVELNEAKSQFISNVSHELRTPLFNIKSFIETLSEYGEELTDKERKEFLETANHETDRLTRLVNDVLDLSRLESHKIYQLESVDLPQLIEQTLRTYQLNAKDKEIALFQDIEQDLAPVLGHYDLLLQLLTNLVGNALKFTKPGGKVKIWARQVRESIDDANQIGRVRIEIADTGIGIDREDREAIFDRFFRVENRVHTLEGTGLGLSIVKNIIDKHHTEINLISEVGVGTTFWFELQLYEQQNHIISESNPILEINTPQV
ncbi:MAG: ATP-binding protein [Prochloraceae cyanobacterium]|nr:ATP-binding protein [Prochloraceae cyanobacterium]